MTEDQKTCPPSFRVSEWLVVLCLVVFALTIRLVFFSQWASTPLFRVPVGDELNFHHTALGLLGMKERPDTFFYQPLYSFFLAGVYGCCGVDMVFVKTLQLLIGVGTVFLCYGLARELGGRQAGRWAAFLAASYGPFVFFEPQLLAVTLVVFMVPGAFWCLLSGAKRDKPWLLFLSGLLMGLSCMARPNLLIVVLVGGGWWILQKMTPKRRWMSLALAAFGLLLGVGPAWSVNATRGEAFTFVSASAGHSFFLGNNDQATGGFHVPRGYKIDDSSHQAYRESLGKMASHAKY